MNFPFMIPYASPSYFILLALLLLPIVISMLWKRKRHKGYQLFVTAFFLYVSFGGTAWHQGLALIIYVWWQTLLSWGYFRYRQKLDHKSVFYLCTSLAILPLVLLKTAPFFQPILSTLIGFLGISYLTFKSVQVIMEIRDGAIKVFRLQDYVQFLVFFPTISSGPIDRYRRFTKDLSAPPDREHYLEMLDKGIFQIFLGFLYKFILGYYLGQVFLPVLEYQARLAGGISLPLIGYMYIYSLYLFFDFAGYSLFAIGVSKVMGFDTPANFNKPFLSWNIKEFWNRWHISLSFWFRDYVYMRLMFALLKKKSFKSRVTASNIGYFVLFLLMGLWHGLTWYYIGYGIYHASLICLTDAWLRFRKKHKHLPSNPFTKGMAVVLTFHAVAIGFLLFSGLLDKILFHPL